MGDFFEKNKVGLGIAALIGIAATVLTGGFGLLPLGLAIGAFFLPGLLSGENNFLSGLFGGGEEKKKPDGTDTPQPQVAPAQAQEESRSQNTPATPPAGPKPPARRNPPGVTRPTAEAEPTAQAAAAKPAAPAAPNPPAAGAAIPLRIMDEKGNLLLQDSLEKPAFVLSNDEGKATHAVFGRLAADRATYEVHAISSILKDEVQGIGWNTGTPISLPVRSGQIDLGNPEFLAAQQQVSDYVKPKDLAITTDKDTGMLATVIGQATVDGQQLDVVMLGTQTRENYLQFTNFALQDQFGRKMLASTGQIISSPIEGFPEVAYADNKFPMYTGAALDMTQQAAQAMVNIRESDAGYIAHKQPEVLTLQPGRRSGEYETKLGQTTIEDKTYDMLLLGNETSPGTITFGSYALRQQGTDELVERSVIGGALTTAAGGSAYANMLFPGDSQPVTGQVNNTETYDTVSMYQGDLPLLRERAAQSLRAELADDNARIAHTNMIGADGRPLHAAEDGTQVIVVHPSTHNSTYMEAVTRQFFGNNPHAVNMQEFETFISPGTHGVHADIQIAYEGRTSDDGSTFNVSRRHLVINQPDGQTRYITQSGPLMDYNNNDQNHIAMHDVNQLLYFSVNDPALNTPAEARLQSALPPAIQQQVER
ncbi:MAG: hypothetical protein AB7L92_07490, partial [Alphaproteobacteria bacterium]